MTLREAFTHYLSFRGDSIAQRSRAMYARQAEGFMRMHEKAHIHEITRQHALDWIQFELKRLNPNTVKARIKVLRYFFEWSVGNEWLRSNPFNKTHLPRIRKQRTDRVPFTFNDYQAITRETLKPQYMKWGRRSFWYTACLLGWHTGLRISDVAHVERKHINWEDETLTVYPVKKELVREKLVIPIEPELYQHLLDIEKDIEEVRSVTRYICAGLNSLMTLHRHSERYVFKEFRIICDNAGLPHHSFHSFRHGFVTRLLNAGVDPITISEMTGQTLAQVQEYAHVSTDAKAAALERSRNAMYSARRQRLGFHGDVQPKEIALT